MLVSVGATSQRKAGTGQTYIKDGRIHDFNPRKKDLLCKAE
jgi:hypothetical protein